MNYDKRGGKMDTYATAKQLAGYYKVGTQIIYNLAKEMEAAGGGVIRLGKAVRIPVDEFQQFLKERMKKGADNEL